VPFQRILERVDAARDRVGIAAATLNVEKFVVSHMPPVDVRIARDAAPSPTAGREGGSA